MGDGSVRQISRDLSPQELRKRAADDGLKGCRDWLDAQDEEIKNCALVAALLFTVAAAAILQPHEANITGSHTDLYGSLCCLSLLANLGCVLFSTLITRTIRF